MIHDLLYYTKQARLNVISENESSLKHFQKTRKIDWTFFVVKNDGCSGGGILGTGSMQIAER